MIDLLDITLTDTAMIFTENEIVVLTSSKKLKILSQLSGIDQKGVPSLVLLEKNNKEPSEKFKEIFKKLKTSVGYPKEDKLEGSFGPLFLESVLKTDKMTFKDISDVLIETKQTDNIDFVKKSAQLATRVVKYAFVKRMEDIIDEDLSISHTSLSDEITKNIKNPANVRSKLSPELCGIEMSPTIQSGGKYDFGLTVKNEETKIKFDTIVFSTAVTFRKHVSYIARTLMIGPSKFQERTYNTLIKVYKSVLENLSIGKELSDVYKKAITTIEEDNKELVQYFTKDCGWAIGMKFKDDNLVIDENCSLKIEKEMTFCVRVGFLNASNGSKKFSCLVGDTVLVKSSGSEALTKYNYKFGDVMYEIEESDEEEEDEVVEITGNTKLKRSLRSSKKTKQQLEQEKTNANLEKMIREKQKSLLLARAERERNKDTNDEVEQEIKVIERKYKTTREYPSNLKKNQIFCDVQREVVFVPIFGYHVPFHISTIKTVSKVDEELATLLRINFFYPTGSSGFSKDISAEMKNVIETHPDLVYVKEMSFKSKDGRNLNKQLRMIKELQKKVRARQKKKEQQADLVDQVDLILNQTSKKPRLRDISMKPALHKGKCIGSLTAHTNGFRFRSNKGEVFDLIYSNIKHFIFQPCDHELIVLVHCNLKNPVMVGSKTKTSDVQFYAEAVDGSTALDSNRRTMYDPDEIDEEYRERQLRKRLNKAFKSFSDQVISVIEKNNLSIGENNEYDIPYRNLGFKGVPNKEMVLLQPTVHCLVNLTETPFFVVSLDEVEHIHFERTDFRVSKSFDMVFILKNHLKQDNTKVPQRIQTIPVDKFELIKQWIHEKDDITFTCGTTPLNWKNVMVGVREELEMRTFWEESDLNGEKKALGWNFLSLEDVASGDEAEEIDDGDSVFEEEDEESEESEAWSADEASSDDDEEDTDESDGEDWDALDKKAAASDRKKEKKEIEKASFDDRHKSTKKRRR